MPSAIDPTSRGSTRTAAASATSSVAPGRGDDGRSLRHRLEHREPEPLAEARVHGQGGALVQPIELVGGTQPSAWARPSSRPSAPRRSSFHHGAGEDEVDVRSIDPNASRTRPGSSAARSCRRTGRRAARSRASRGSNSRAPDPPRADPPRDESQPLPVEPGLDARRERGPRRTHHEPRVAARERQPAPEHHQGVTRVVLRVPQEHQVVDRRDQRRPRRRDDVPHVVHDVDGTSGAFDAREARELPRLVQEPTRQR